MIQRSKPIRLGKIGYLNVLPIYHSIEKSLIDHDFELVTGPPAKLNRAMARGELDISAASSIEYARHAEDYLLVPNLSIGSRGPVQSVLLLSRVPVLELEDATILVSSQTHTSAALLRILLEKHLGINVGYETGDASSTLESGTSPQALLAIGNEALELRRHPEYPYSMDLGETWRQWTGLPFIFGLWLVNRKSWLADNVRMETACRALIAAKEWGTEHMGSMCRLAAESSSLDGPEMCSYFNGLVYDLEEKEQLGLQLFFEHLYDAGYIESVPELKFIALK